MAKAGAGGGSKRRGGRPRAAGEEAGQEGKGSSRVREWARSIAVAAVLFLVIRFFLVQTFVITSGSMEDGLLVGDLLVANRAAFGARIPGTTRHLPGYSEPHRGDVVVFDPHHDVDEPLVKRLVGLPGDTLRMAAGQLWVNGEARDEPYVKHTSPGTDAAAPEMAWQRDYLVGTVDPRTYTPTRDDWGPLVVPEGHFFMLGDNRDTSYDSRYWGPLATWRLIARVSFVYYSWDANRYKPFPWITAARWRRIGKRVR